MAVPEKWIEQVADQCSSYLQKFRLYETRSNLYMIGRDINRTFWRILKVDRTEPMELNILEDPTSYTETECFELLRRIHEGNRSTGGLKFVTTCYGIVGFLQFLGPYYMLIITKRRKLGAICGHTVYAVAKSEMITIPHSSVLSNVAYSKDEKRYKKLLGTVDLTKDFYFSYSYNIMHSLQRNLCNNVKGHVYYESMFVWNEYLTQEIRSKMKHCMWTVALVYGFFKQVELSISEKRFKLTLIARRSRHYAGTRYLKRGVNEKGRVANDVETEQIVFEDVPEGSPVQISSVVQNRGSIPLFWSQETSRLNIKPDILLSRKDPNFEATRLHFDNLTKRYGSQIIILNLIKTREKKPRETILCAEFANAIKRINKGLSKEERLRPLHWDLHKHSRNKATNVLAILGKLAAYALNLTGIFYCQLSPDLRAEGLQNSSCLIKNKVETDSNSTTENDNDTKEDGEMKSTMIQKGVMRTNCIDCLDRTNVAQFAYGLAALGHQLHTLGFIESNEIDLDYPLAEDLMGIYEMMGDTLALQYGGSAAHNKIFCERRGQWRAATQSQELFRALQRYYSNAYMDAEKQDAINIFLGYFQPQPDKPALWEIGSDQHYNAARFGTDIARSSMKRSLSEGNILLGHGQPLSETDQEIKELSDSTPEISMRGSNCRQMFEDLDPNHVLETDCLCYDEHSELYEFPNLNVDWVSSSGNSCEDDVHGRSIPLPSSSENVPETGSRSKGAEMNESNYTRKDVISGIPDRYVQWVFHGGHFW